MEKKIGRRALLLWRIRLCLCALPCPFLIALFFPGAEIWSAVLTVLWVSVFLGMFLLYYPIKYQRLRYTLGGHSLQVHCGVFYNRLKAIDLNNIQHVSSVAGPLQRLLSLASVYVAGAGGVIALPCLEAANARALCERLLEGERGERR